MAVHSVYIFLLSINIQYMTNSTLLSPVKMEYGWSFSISGLKMMMKSGLGKIFLKFLHALLTMSFLLLNFDQKYKFSNNMASAWRIFKNVFPRPLFIIIFRSEMLKFHPYSILTGDTRVEFVIYCVLSFSNFKICSTIWSTNCSTNCSTYWSTPAGGYLFYHVWESSECC